jgi:hypothetical protein
MADFSLITDHPDSKDILSKLLSGSTPKEVAQWLKIKYPGKDQSHLRLTQKLLKEFNNSQYTNVYDQFKSDIVQVSQKDKDNDKVLSASLLNNKTYRDRLQEIADKEFNILRVLDNLVVVTHDRLEQVFDRIQEQPGSFDGDRTLLNYINTMFEIADKLEKIRLSAPETIMQQNVTMQAVEEYMAIYQEAIRETLAEIDPDTAMLFMDKLYNKLNELKPPTPMTQEERIQEATVLHERVIGDEDDTED